MSDDFEKFVTQQFPFRPSGPDWERLREVVEQVEEWKRQGVEAMKPYEDLMDVYAASYLAVQRAGSNMPYIPPGFRVLADKVMQFGANAWLEGFLFGVLFQQYGGTQTEEEAAVLDKALMLQIQTHEMAGYLDAAKETLDKAPVKDRLLFIKAMLGLDPVRELVEELEEADKEARGEGDGD